MRKANFRETDIMKTSDPKTLDELKTTFSDIELFLKNEDDVFYYNVMASLSEVCRNFLNRYYEKNEDEINALMKEDDLCKNSDPYIIFLDKQDGGYFSEYYTDKLYEIIGIKRENADPVTDKFITHFELLSVCFEGDNRPIYQIAGKDIPIKWAYRKFIEFDREAWEKIYAYYLEHWSPEVMKKKNIRYVVDYPDEDKMLAYYYLDFWYER